MGVVAVSPGTLQPKTTVAYKMPDGTIRQWDMATEPKPDSIGNDSRCGFLWNCYHSSMGRFFQNTIKHGITSVLSRIHDKEIPRYDSQAYTYDDPRLRNLERILKESFARHVTDQDCARKQEIINQAIDIVLFMMKEDIFYRGRVFAELQDLGRDVQAHPEHYLLSPQEAFNYYRFPLNLEGLHAIGVPIQALVDQKIIDQGRADRFFASLRNAEAQPSQQQEVPA